MPAKYEGHSITAIKHEIISAEMRSRGLYKYWANNVKSTINTEWDRITKAYTKDVQRCKSLSRTKPKSTDPIYYVHGFTVICFYTFINNNNTNY